MEKDIEYIEEYILNYCIKNTIKLESISTEISIEKLNLIEKNNLNIYIKLKKGKPICLYFSNNNNYLKNVIENINNELEKYIKK